MNVESLTPLLIALASGALTQEAIPPSLTHNLNASDWDTLLLLANHHGLAPLLHNSLSRLGCTVPQTVTLALEKRAYMSEFCNALALDQLEAVVAALNIQGIEPALLKGACFALQYYPSPGLRPFSDLDIVVPKERREQAAQVLTGLDYTLEQHVNGIEAAWWAEHHYHWLFRSQRGLPLELHWALTKPETTIQFDMESLWQRSELLSCGAARARRFTPEDTILYLAVHAAKHGFRIPLRNHVDLATLLNTTETQDWDVLRQRAQALGAQMDLAAFLGLGKELGLISLPEEVGTWARRTADGKIDFPAFARFAVKWPCVERPGVLLHPACLLTRDQLSRSLRAVRGILFPARRPLRQDERLLAQTCAPARRSQRHRLTRFWHLLGHAWTLVRETRHLRSEIAINRLFHDREFSE